MTNSRNNGYQPCGCRDCMEIAIGEPGVLCLACDDAGCDGTGECAVEDAYGTCDQEDAS